MYAPESPHCQGLPLPYMVCSEKVKVAQSCLTFCNSVDCSLPFSSVYGIIQARIPEWVAVPCLRASSQPRNQTQASHIAGGFFTILSHQGNPRILDWVAYPFSKDLPDPGIEPGFPALQVDSLSSEPPGKCNRPQINSHLTAYPKARPPSSTSDVSPLLHPDDVLSSLNLRTLPSLLPWLLRPCQQLYNCHISLRTAF